MNSNFAVCCLVVLAHILSSQDVVFRSMFFLIDSEKKPFVPEVSNNSQVATISKQMERQV